MSFSQGYSIPRMDFNSHKVLVGLSTCVVLYSLKQQSTCNIFSDHWFLNLLAVGLIHIFLLLWTLCLSYRLRYIVSAALNRDLNCCQFDYMLSYHVTLRSQRGDSCYYLALFSDINRNTKYDWRVCCTCSTTIITIALGGAASRTRNDACLLKQPGAGGGTKHDFRKRHVRRIFSILSNASPTIYRKLTIEYKVNNINKILVYYHKICSVTTVVNSGYCT